MIFVYQLLPYRTGKCKHVSLCYTLFHILPAPCQHSSSVNNFILVDIHTTFVLESMEAKHLNQICIGRNIFQHLNTHNGRGQKKTSRAHWYHGESTGKIITQRGMPRETPNDLGRDNLHKSGKSKRLKKERWKDGKTGDVKKRQR